MNYRKLTCIFLWLTPVIAHAGAVSLMDSSLRGAINGTITTLQNTALLWLSAFVMLQFLITQLGLLKSGADLEAIWGKLLGSLLWFGFCFYVMQEGAGFIDKVSQGFFNTAGNMSGAGHFNAAYIIDSGATLAGNLLGKINSASGITDLFMPSLIGGLLGVVIIVTAGYIGFKVFILKIETLLIIMLAPLSFAFLGLNALKDQGIAPFKALLSLLYRVILLAVILGTMKGMSDNLVGVIQDITSDSLEGIWSVLFAAVMGYVLLAFLTHKSDSIAASLASGSTQLGTSDAATAAAIGAAVGGAVGSAGASLGAGRVPGMMGDWMKQAFGSNGVGVSNASDMGSGGLSSSALNPDTPSMSMADRGSAPSAGGTEPSAGAGEMPGEQNGGGQSPLEYPGTPIPSESHRDPGRDAAREARRQAKDGGGSGAKAGIASSAPMEQPLSNAKRKSFGDHMSELNQHLVQEKAATHVSINTHHE